MSLREEKNLPAAGMEEATERLAERQPRERRCEGKKARHEVGQNSIHHRGTEDAQPEN